MRKQLQKSEIKDLNTALQEQYGIEPLFDKKDTIENIDGLYIIKDKRAQLFFYEHKQYPSLHLLLVQLFLPRVVVDMGAVRFVTKGADIMRPGITRIDDNVTKDNAIVIVDEKHGKPLAVGIALLDAADMRAQSTGKVIKNIHYVGDAIWNYSA